MQFRRNEKLNCQKRGDVARIGLVVDRGVVAKHAVAVVVAKHVVAVRVAKHVVAVRVAKHVVAVVDVIRHAEVDREMVAEVVVQGGVIKNQSRIVS